MRLTKFIPGATLSKFENKNAPTRTLILTFRHKHMFPGIRLSMIKFSLK